MRMSTRHSYFSPVVASQVNAAEVSEFLGIPQQIRQEAASNQKMNNSLVCDPPKQQRGSEEGDRAMKSPGIFWVSPYFGGKLTP